MSAFENNGARDFDLGALARSTTRPSTRSTRCIWPLREGEAAEDTRFFADGGFFTPDRKARFIAPEFPALREALRTNYPFVLNTGRVRDQWHTMTRTGLSPRLALHVPEPFVEIHPDDARAHRPRKTSRASRPQHGSGIFKVALNDGQQRGALFAPIHWSGETASSARTCELVSPHTDPYSGQPEAKATPATIAPVGFRLSRLRADTPADCACRRKPGGRASRSAAASAICWRSEEGPKLWREHAHELMICAELAEFIDIPRGIYRAAAFRDGRLESCLFVGPAGAAPQWDAVKALFEAETIADLQRRMLLSGRAADGLAEIGPVICACFGVGLNVIREAIASKERHQRRGDRQGAARGDELRLVPARTQKDRA